MINIFDETKLIVVLISQLTALQDAIKDTTKMTALQWFELIYYIAFIILTAILAYYAFKSYKLGANRRYELLCKLTVPDLHIESYRFYYYLEIYNAGNMVAKNIDVFVSGKKLTEIDFVKPNSAELFPLGVMACLMNGNRSMSNGSFKIENGETIDIRLCKDGKTLKYSLNTDILFETKPSENHLRDIDNSLKNIANEIGKTRR